MNVIFRVDASAEIGLGHLARCLSLAQALRTLGARCLFLARELGLALQSRVDAAGFELRLLPAPRADVDPATDAPAHARWARVGQDTDVADAATALAGLQPEWAVIDHYAFDARWHRAWRSRVGGRVAAIDDLGDRDLAVDLVVDHNVAADHAAKYAGRLGPGATLLGGPRFALIAPAYARAPRCRPGPEVGSIGIFLGGSDAGGYSLRALEVCTRAGFTGPVEVVATSAHPHLSALQEAARRRPQTTLSLDLPDLAAFFARHDLQIGASGGSTWERCCIGAPTLAVMVAENQRMVLEPLAGLGVLEAVLEYPNDDLTWAGALRSLLDRPAQRLAMSERATALVDGRGAERVALRMLADRLALRPATPEDADLLYRWRNHPATRAVSRDPRPIDRDAHVAWLARSLADTARRLWIGHVGRVDIGTIRFDAGPQGDAEVSLYLDPDLHGLGLGGRLLRAGETEARRAGLAQRLFVATVLDANAGSRQLFRSGGYQQGTGGQGLATPVDTGQSLWTKDVPAGRTPASEEAQTHVQDP
ncbi:MAG: UDP-2,4-diacetamido-2,4,6-trideoxy-beta-L-altropyranose hydrolase [Betaproteobacteria bacterium]